MNDVESKVIIGLPVYNGDQTIRRSIESILSQTFKKLRKTNKLVFRYKKNIHLINCFSKKRIVTFTKFLG